MNASPPAEACPETPGTRSWEAEARWIRAHLPEMRFRVQDETPTICTVWIAHDEQATKQMRLSEILTTLFGASSCGPASTWAKGPPHTSFGFWNAALLQNARRVFPLPDALQPGPLLFLNGLTQEEWACVERRYNKQPGDLPRR